jgi:regulator of replication initiation timing
MATAAADSEELQARVALLEKEKEEALELIKMLRAKIYALEEENDLLALDNERLKGREGGREGGRERGREGSRKKERRVSHPLLSSAA